MKNATRIHLNRLVRVCGTYSDVARYLGITPRWMRRIRSGNIPPQSARKISLAGGNLQLRALLSELRRAGVVTPAHLHEAWARLRAQEAQTPRGNPGTTAPSTATPVAKSA